MSKWKKLAIGVSAATVLSLPYFVGERVKEVKDGDTFVIGNGQLVRLFGVDAPEPENCYGPEATKELRKLISGKKVVLREPIVDQYRRVVALVYADGKLVNETMIKEGFALYTRSGESETKIMHDANEYARANNIGIFSSKCYQPNPIDPKCVIKGNFDRDKKDMIYIRPDCPYYDKTVVEKFRGERYFCSEAEAKKAGFTLAKFCK